MTMDLIETLRVQQTALVQAEERLLRMGDRAGAEVVRKAYEPIDFPTDGKRPQMLLITGRARCNCENGEIVAESIALPYAISQPMFNHLCTVLLHNLRAEVDAHILKQGHK